ncbi:MFS transporter [Streptacidiphilus anmyonensis]|uniref:MFS transporter n=1 Tax=Streptacidiphilus anmyonensis TaxID=405782 RepID=UPI0005AAA705|nr:MFS transporter [Streptacidiphilus anmyonensis]
MTVNPSRATIAKSLDDAKLSVFHLKAAVTAGAGFFTDSYDLNVIGTVTLLITPQFHLGSGQVAMLTSSTLLAVAVGAMFFGRLGDLLGRRRVYGLEAVLMITGALVSALAPNFVVLLVGRLVLGIGIGGDYPASGVIMTEYANARNRGRLVGLTFIFYVFGQVSAYLVSLLVVAVGVPDDLAWRLILGLGVLPSLLVLHQRRHMPESPRWTAHSGDPARAARDLAAFAQLTVTPEPTRQPLQPSDHQPDRPSAPERAHVGRAAAAELSKRRLLSTLAGTAGSWFFYNVAVYGINVSQPLLLKNIVPHATMVTNLALNAVLVVCFSLSGGILGVVALDRLPRRTQQAAGFGLCALAMTLITVVPGLSATVLPFAVTFGLSLFGSIFGPNYTTMLIAAESYPTPVRSTFHGLSSGIAKVGAFTGALVVPLILAGGGLRIVTLIAAVCFLAGTATTFLVREPGGRTLEDVGEALALTPSAPREDVLSV